jgi:hypothetical protein
LIRSALIVVGSEHRKKWPNSLRERAVEMKMATGLFRTSDGSVQVDYDGISIPIPRSKYNENGYKPDFNELPLAADYWAAQEEQRAADAQKRL